MLETPETILSLALWEQVGWDISEGKEVSTWSRRGKRLLCSALCHTHRHQAALRNPAPGSTHRILPQEGLGSISSANTLLACDLSEELS